MFLIAGMGQGADEARQPSRSELFCPAVREWVAGAFSARTRVAVFAWEGPYEGQCEDDPESTCISLPMYSNMHAAPEDEAADQLYDRIAWRTHYERDRPFARRIADCLDGHRDFARVSRQQGAEFFRARYSLPKLRRSIRVEASGRACEAWRRIAGKPPHDPGRTTCVVIEVETT